jgi:hypothetical protein
VKAAFAYRKGELNDKEIERILAEVPGIVADRVRLDASPK